MTREKDYTEGGRLTGKRGFKRERKYYKED